MVKKGKYNLLSYIVDKDLIYYKSISRNKKIIAFALLETKNTTFILTTLNDFLKKRFIKYYSIQLNTFENSKNLYILNFEDYKKSRILQVFNLIYHHLIDNSIVFKFLKGKLLEKRFLALIFKYPNINILINVLKSSILITHQKLSKLLTFYNINLTNTKNKKSFIQNFIRIINSFKRKGYLIFNLKISNNDNIEVSAYFIDICRVNENIFNLEKAINDFFNEDLIKIQYIKKKTIVNYLWRLKISDNSYLFEDNKSLFPRKKGFSYESILDQFEKSLLANQIIYLKLNKNLYLIQQKFIFLIFSKLDLNVLYKIIDNYYPKYKIFILLLLKKEYEELKKIKTIKFIRNIKILSRKNFKKLDYYNFKK